MPKRRQPLTVTIFGVTLPIPRWSISVIGLLVCVAIAGLIWKNVGPMDLVTLQAANEEMAAQITEYNTHMMEDPEKQEAMFDDARGRLSIRVYTDGCVVIQRKTALGARTKLVPDLSRMKAEVVKPSEDLRLWDRVFTVVSAQGRCWNPHPGQFATSYGQRNGCVVPVFRTFTDGCVHYQFLNTCNGYWDANPDGSPRVTWTRCVH